MTEQEAAEIRDKVGLLTEFDLPWTESVFTPNDVYNAMRPLSRLLKVPHWDIGRAVMPLVQPESAPIWRRLIAMDIAPENHRQPLLDGGSLPVDVAGTKEDSVDCFRGWRPETIKSSLEELADAAGPDTTVVDLALAVAGRDVPAAEWLVASCDDVVRRGRNEVRELRDFDIDEEIPSPDSGWRPTESHPLRFERFLGVAEDWKKAFSLGRVVKAQAISFRGRTSEPLTMSLLDSDFTPQADYPDLPKDNETHRFSHWMGPDRQLASLRALREIERIPSTAMPDLRLHCEKVERLCSDGIPPLTPTEIGMAYRTAMSAGLIRDPKGLNAVKEVGRRWGLPQTSLGLTSRPDWRVSHSPESDVPKRSATLGR